MNVFHVRAVVAGMNDGRDRLEPLGAAQLPSNPGRQQVRSVVTPAEFDSLREIEPEELLETAQIVESVRQEYRVKRHRYPRRSPHDPAKPPIDGAATITQRA